MTITSDIQGGKRYPGNGVTAAFTVPWRVDDASELSVTLIDDSTYVESIPTYAVSGLGAPTATVTLTPAPAAGVTVEILPALAFTQPVNLRSQRVFNPETVEAALDRQTKLMAQIPTRADVLRLIERQADPSGISAAVLRSDLASAVAAKGAALLGFLRGGVGAIGRTLQGKLEEWISPKDFGAIGNAVTDDTAKIRAMFAAADAITADPNYVQGALVQIPPGSYGISDTITLTRPPMVQGAGYAERSANPLGDGRGITQFVALPGLAGKPMFRIKSGTPNEVVHGGKFLGINLLGMDIASYGIWGSSMSHCDFDVRVHRFTVAGIRSDDGNGALADRNTFDAHVVTGGSVATQNAHGLWIIGVNAGAPGTGNPQNIIKRLDGVTLHGDGLRLEGDVDNTIILHTAMALQPGGTGRNMAYLSNGGVPRVNFCHYTAGGLIQLDAGTYGNTFRTSSEGTTFTGAGLYDVLTTDYATGGFWQTRRYYLSDRLDFTAADFVNSGPGPAMTNISSLSGWALDAAAIETISACKPAPITWRNGSLTGLAIWFGITTGGQPVGASVRFQVSIRSISQNESLAVNVNTYLVTVPLTNLAANLSQLASIAFTVPEVVTAGDIIGLQIARIGNDAVNDTVLGDVFVLGAQLQFVSLGPQSVGSGTIQVPSMGT